MTPRILRVANITIVRILVAILNVDHEQKNMTVTIESRACFVAKMAGGYRIYCLVERFLHPFNSALFNALCVFNINIATFADGAQYCSNLYKLTGSDIANPELLFIAERSDCGSVDNQFRVSISV